MRYSELYKVYGYVYTVGSTVGFLKNKIRTNWCGFIAGFTHQLVQIFCGDFIPQRCGFSDTSKAYPRFHCKVGNHPNPLTDTFPVSFR